MEHLVSGIVRTERISGLITASFMVDRKKVSHNGLYVVQIHISQFNRCKCTVVFFGRRVYAGRLIILNGIGIDMLIQAVDSKTGTIVGIGSCFR